MEITWYGLSCFRLTERGSAPIVTDPFDASTGLGALRAKGDIVTVSHYAPGHGAAASVNGQRYVLDRPGEYEIGGVFITGIATYNAVSPDSSRLNTVFVYEIGGVQVCHIGDFDHVPDQSQVEAAGAIDVLLIPVGGGRALSSSAASEVISVIEPRIVIPMHYAQPGLQLNLDPLDRFMKEMGGIVVEPQSSLKVTRNSLPEDTQVVILESVN